MSPGVLQSVPSGPCFRGCQNPASGRWVLGFGGAHRQSSGRQRVKAPLLDPVREAGARTDNAPFTWRTHHHLPLRCAGDASLGDHEDSRLVGVAARRTVAFALVRNTEIQQRCADGNKERLHTPCAIPCKSAAAEGVRLETDVPVRARTSIALFSPKMLLSRTEPVVRDQEEVWADQGVGEWDWACGYHLNRPVLHPGGPV
jgi:hypothetical protein